MNDFIVKKIKDLRLIEPDASWLASQRSFLLSEISQVKKKEEKGTRLVFPFFNFSKIFRPAFATALATIILISSLATVGVIGAAQNSLPGDILYPVKTAFEKTQLTFTPGEANKTKLSIKFATQRMDEFTRLVEKPEKKEDIEKTVREFTAQLVSVQQKIDELKEKNAEKAAEVAKIVKAQTSLYEESLIESSEKLANIIPGEKKNLKENIDQALAEVNKTKEITEELIPEEERALEEASEPFESPASEEVLVPTEEEGVESPSVPFENLQEEIIPQEEEVPQEE